MGRPIVISLWNQKLNGDGDGDDDDDDDDDSKGT